MPDPPNRAQGTGNIVLLSLLLLVPALILARSQDQTKCSDKVYKPITALVRGSNTFAESQTVFSAFLILCPFVETSYRDGNVSSCGHSHPETNSVNNCDMVMDFSSHTMLNEN